MAIRVLLDTCTVRHFIYEDPGHLDLCRIRKSKSKLLISIGYPASLEIADYITNHESFPFVRWGTKGPELDSILDPEFPIFPGGIHLTSLLGNEDVPKLTHDDKLVYRKSWQLMRSASSRCDLAKGITYSDSKGEATIPFDGAMIRKEIEDERRWFIDSFPKFEKHAKQVGTTVEHIADLIAGFEPKVFAQAYAILLVMKQKGYDPTSIKRQGDVFDISLLLALELPAIAVTHDEKFVNRARQTKAPEARLLMTVDEFHDKLDKGELEDLVSSI